MNESTPERKEVKRRFQLWVKPSTLEFVDKLMADDNCGSRSEFIEKAILFYVGYLSSNASKNYLPNVVISTLKSIVSESDNRQNRMIFKLAVEIAIMQNLIASMQNLIASMQEVDPVSMERLRAECVKEVKRLNGSFAFEDALSWQQG